MSLFSCHFNFKNFTGDKNSDIKYDRINTKKYKKDNDISLKFGVLRKLYKIKNHQISK